MASGRSTFLLPNLGGEEEVTQEGRPPRLGRQALELVSRAARLWALLFGAEARLAPGDDPVPWPAALGPRAVAPAFAWIEDAGHGVPWLGTAAARSTLRETGHADRGPDPEVVRRVHDKAFSLVVADREKLTPTSLDSLLVVLDGEALAGAGARARLAARIAAWPSWTGGKFILKPRWGSSGRGGLRGAGPDLRGVTEARLAALAARGGAVLEPWLDRELDLSTQLHVAGDGAVEILGTTRQLVSAHGVWLGSRGEWSAAGEACAGSAHDAAIASAARVVARAAAAAGYRGPCGVDAFVFRGPGGDPTLRLVVELNARFTMGTVALGLLRRAAAAGALAGPAAWCFTLRSPPGPWDAARRVPGVRVLPLADGPLPDRPALVLAESPERLDALLARFTRDRGATSLAS